MGILNSDDYASLEPGRFVVFSGQYDSQRAANQGLQDLSGQVEGAYVRHVAPRAVGRWLGDGHAGSDDNAPPRRTARRERQLRWVGKLGCHAAARPRVSEG